MTRYGVLFSHASEDVIPGLVIGDFDSRQVAEAYAAPVAVGGIIAYIATRERPVDPWYVDGVAPREVLDRV
jgi:hypothetical protein